MEHPLLNTRAMRRSVLLIAAAVLACALPSTAFALSPTVGAFGTGSHAAGNTNLVTLPIGTAECATDIPLAFAGLTASTTMRYLDVWWASSAAAGCQTSTTRANMTSPVCHYVTSIPYTTGPNTTVHVSAETLFGGCTSDQRTFYFFDTATMEENSMTFTAYWTLDVAIDATAPVAPVITSTPAGDTQLQIAWNASSFTDLGMSGRVYVYADSTGCTGDGGTSSLVPGATAPSTTLASLAASNPATLQASLLGWSTGTYGQSAAIAIAVVDTAGNVSPLSNVVCASHVQVSGFFDQYCAAHGMTDTTACANNYRGCSVGLPSRRIDLAACALGLLVAGVFVARRRAR